MIKNNIKIYSKSQIYTCSLFNITNIINYKLKTLFINIFTVQDFEEFCKTNDKIVIYNSRLHFFNYLDIVNKVIKSKVPIYSDDKDIRTYLFENNANPTFAIKNIKNIDTIQLYVAEYLSKTFVEDFNNLNNISIKFEKFADKNKPCVFYGIYSENDIKLFESINSYKIIIWTGGDINIDHEKNNIKNIILSNIKRILNVKDVYHISISNFISNKLDKLGIIYKVIPFMPINLNEFIPIKKGKSIYIYVGDGTEVYGRKLYNDIYKRLKNNYSFIFASNTISKNIMLHNPEIPNIVYTSKNNIKNIYSECFIGLCFTKHDGLSATIQELGCMGIRSISNLISPSTINYNKILDENNENNIDEYNKAFDEIINIINNEYKNIDVVNCKLSETVKNFLTIPSNNLNIKYLKKQKKLKYLYIHNYDFNESYHTSLLINYFDIIGIKYIDIINPNDYKCVIFDPLIFVKYLNDIPNIELLLNRLSIIENKIMLFHDLHNFSFNNNLKNFLIKYNIKYTISIYECYEHIFLNDFLSKNITKSFLLNHYYNNQIFYNRNNKKIYDILIYGNTNNKIYPFQERLLKICKSMNLNIMEVKYDYSKSNSIIEDELSILINKSWLSISCCSISDYFLGKYLEIIGSGSIIIGNINDHGRTIIENLLIEVNNNYSDELIKSIILYYLNNRDLLIYLSMKSYNKIKNYTYDNYSDILYNICNSIINNSVSEFEYNNILNKKLNNIDKTTYDYDLINIQNNNDFIVNICKCPKCFVIRILKCGEYYFKSNKLININIETEFISDYNNIYYDGNYYVYFTLIKSNYKLNLNTNYNINYYYIQKYNRFNRILYNKENTINYINIASFLSKGFKNPILNNYNNLSEYNLSNSPSFFYGMGYDDEFKIISNKSNLSIVIYTGGDIDINNKYSYTSIITKINTFKNMPNVRFISISSFISKALKQLNIPYIYLPFMGIDLNKFNPCIKGNSIYIYTNHIKETYGMDLFLKIIEKYKNINFLLCTHPAQYDLAVKHKMTDIYTKLNIQVIDNIDKLIEIYKKCFLGLRLTKFDGLAATVQELGCMGIKSIHNGSTPSSLNYNNFDDICNLIDNEMKTIGTIDYELSNKVKNFLKIDPIYFNENYYYNNINYYFSKIYILNLKRQDKKRERIIRLMEKNSINNYTLFDAINGYTEPHYTDWKKYKLIPFDEGEQKLKRKKIGSAGVWGNLISVRDILITAKKNNENRILFFEDDIILHKNFNKEFTENIRQVPDDWLIILLGASINQLDSSSKKINSNIYTCGKMVSGGFSICIDNKIYDELIDECNKFNNPFDNGPLDYVINKYYNKCYIMYPNIVICNVEESTLRNNTSSMSKYSKLVKWNLNNFDLTV